MVFNLVENSLTAACITFRLTLLGTQATPPAWQLLKYIGQTSRCLSTRSKKLKRDCRLGDTSAIASHCGENYDAYDFEEPKILATESKLREGLFFWKLFAATNR